MLPSLMIMDLEFGQGQLRISIKERIAEGNK